MCNFPLQNKWLACKVCKALYPTKKTLNTHMSNIHYGKGAKQDGTDLQQAYRLSRPSRPFLTFLDLNWPKIRSKMPKNDLKSQTLIFSSKIHTQFLRLCRKVALIGSLSLLEDFWPKIGQKMRPKMAQKDL